MLKDLTKPEVILSASTIKQLEDCSYLHYVKKVLNFPNPGNPGSSRGSILHLIAELLHIPRHRKHYKLLFNTGKLSSCPSVDRLVIKHLKAYGIYEPEHYNLVEEMLKVALGNDFYATGKVVKGIEQQFIIRNENPKYSIIGYIDRLVVDSDNNVEILDLKSQKKLFTQPELDNNIQAFAYTLAVKKLLIPEAKDVSVKFILLRFPEDPIQEVKVTDTQLAGFEKYLAYMYQLVNNFTEDEARRNFAYDNPKKKWLCKAGATWECPARQPRDFYVLIDSATRKVIKSDFEKASLDKLAKTGQRIERRRYDGCPRHNVTF